MVPRSARITASSSQTAVCLTNPKTIEIDLEKADAWISKGAQPTNSVSHLIDVVRNGQPVVEKKTKISKKAAAKAAKAAEEAAEAAAE